VQSFAIQHTLCAYTDSDWAADITDRRSYTGSAVLFQNSLISWTSKKQAIVSLSSCEAEYIAAAETLKGIVYAKALLQELTHLVQPMPLYIDNQGAIHLAENDVNNKRSKHIDTRYHYIRDYVQSGYVKIFKIPTANNLADIFTKALPYAALKQHTTAFLTD
jgi:hypothetical protein